MAGESSTDGRILGERLVCDHNAWRSTDDRCFDLKFGTTTDLLTMLDQIVEDVCPAGSRVIQ